MPPPAVERTAVPTDQDRQQTVVRTLTRAFEELMERDPAAFRTKFRKMAAEPFAFYRGSAPLFYSDMAGMKDPWADERTSRVWIQADLHAENFGTYLDGEGVLVFDVNDFDEAYVAPFTWDLRRFVASLALIGWRKALPDDAIGALCETYLRSYLDQVRYFVECDDDAEWSLNLGTAEGAVLTALCEAQLATRIGLLDSLTVVDEHRRVFSRGSHARAVEGEEREKVVAAYEHYLGTIPEAKRQASISYACKDVVATGGFGIGSAGLPAYNVLVEGASQALENDIVLSMKQGNVAAPSRVVDNDAAASFFHHHGHRTAVSQAALQAHADPWLGWTELDGVGFVVKELSPYEADLEWDDLAEPDDMTPVVDQLGRATAKIHCVSDVDTEDVPLVDFQVEEAVVQAVGEGEDDFVGDLVRFAHEYAQRAREDHRLFVDAFRGGQVPGVSAT
jgi:uncharacterized protein (DUF2252 family)